MIVSLALMTGTGVAQQNPLGAFEELTDTKPRDGKEVWDKMPAPVQLEWGSTDVRYKKWNVPSGLSGTHSLRLTAWKGERVNAQAVLWTRKDLKNLRSDFRWAGFVDEVNRRKTAIEEGYDHELREELLEIAKTDQEVRYEYLNAINNHPEDKLLTDSLAGRMHEIDSLNLIKIDKILKEHGWPSRKKLWVTRIRQYGLWCSIPIVKQLSVGCHFSMMQPAKESLEMISWL